MAIARVQFKAGSTGAANAGTLNLVLDAAPTNGNILIVAVGSGAGAQINPNANIGWDGVSKPGATVLFSLLVGAVRTASASATIAISLQSSTPCSAVCAEYSGFNNIVFDTGAQATASSTAVNSGAAPVTTQRADELWIGAAAHRATNVATFSAPGGGFSIVGQAGTSNNTSNNDRSVVLMDQIVSATGTPTASCTVDQSNLWIAYVACFFNAPQAVQTGRTFGE